MGISRPLMFLRSRILAVTALLLVLLVFPRSGSRIPDNMINDSTLIQDVRTTARGLLSQQLDDSISSSTQKPLSTEQSHQRPKALFISLVRNSELEGMLHSIQDVEDRFNRRYHYDWIFLNDDDFTEEFKRAAPAATSGQAKFGKIDKEQWSYPVGVDQQIVEMTKQDMGAREDIPYGSSESYRHMCRL